jgi:hypothetical protein
MNHQIVIIVSKEKNMPTATERKAWIETIRGFPERLEAVVGSLPAETLHAHTPTDPWTIAQIVHHCADSHINSFVRLKLTLTEDHPPLKGYDQNMWVAMADEQDAPIESSLAILRGLHQRWAAVFESLVEADWDRVGIHSESGEMSVNYLLSGYAQHCEDHLAQIQRILADA